MELNQIKSILRQRKRRTRRRHSIWSWMIIISFAVGVGNVEGFIISEIMPVYAKDTLMSIGQPLNWIANLTVSTLFPILFTIMGRYAYLIFVGLTFFFGWFTFNKLPETKGKTIAQVTKDFEKY